MASTIVIRKLTILAVSATLTLLGVVLTAAPATASIAQCVRGANGFVDIPYNKTGTVVRSVSLDGSRTAQLHTGYINGVERAWAKITGSTRVNDLVWLDWSRDGGSSWMQCGPFAVQSNGSPNTSAAQKLSVSSYWAFRACGRIVGGSSLCTTWF